MKTSLLILNILLFILPSFALAQSGGGTGYNFAQKAEKKSESRWTLQGWLEQRDRNRMMDLWLSMNSPSPYEFFIIGAYQDFDSKNETNKTESHYNSAYYSLGAYSGIIGLEGFYEKNLVEEQTQSGGSLNLRIVGNAVQGTHLIIHYGYRSLQLTENLQSSIVNQAFAGGDLNLYLTRSFGISGLFRHYFSVDKDVVGSLSGHRTEAGVFIDFSMIRVFGSWYSDLQTTTPNQVEKNVRRTGIMSGLKIFF